MLEFLTSGGPFMWILLGLSIVALSIIVERFYALQMSYEPSASFFRRLTSTVRSGKVAFAIESCHQTTHPLARVVAKLLQNPSRDKETLEAEASVALQKVIPGIQKRTPYLSMIGNVSTLLGLLGTIQGLILSFTSLAGASADAKAELLATGISTAMNTTAFGLIVAIPCIVSFSVLTIKESNIMQKYEGVINEVIHIVTSAQANASGEQADPPVLKKSA